MKRFRTLLAGLAMVLASLTAVTIASPAPAQGQAVLVCGDWHWYYGEPVTWYNSNWNNQHVWQVKVSKRECPTYDEIGEVHVILVKQAGWCILAGTLASFGRYQFNPNAIGGWNPATKAVDCDNGNTVYDIAWYSGAVVVAIRPSDSEAARCIGAVVDINGINGGPNINRTVPSVCFNGS